MLWTNRQIGGQTQGELKRRENETRKLSKIDTSGILIAILVGILMVLLSLLQFLFFDIGCHSIAKCSFVAHTTFLFVKGGDNQVNEEEVTMDSKQI